MTRCLSISETVSESFFVVIIGCFFISTKLYCDYDAIMSPNKTKILDILDL